MKTALVLTTINVPTVLELYRRHGPDVAFFVAGDEKTPTAAYDFVHEKKIGNWHQDNSPICRFYDKEEQDGFGYKCSELIGFSCIQRRNIALLEAAKWGADLIVSIDDDNIPLDGYYGHFQSALNPTPGERSAYHLFSGLKVLSPNGWFDVGQLLDPVAPHRGFPIQADPRLWRVDHVVDAKVGVAAGICLGDPDISAVTRIANAPIVHRVSQLLESGIVVDPGTKTVFNSQNTAFIRELAPAMFMLPGVGRYDDIYASLICQRVMRERGLHVHFGKPFVWQQRNPHNLVKDLRAEIDGMENVRDLAERLDRFSMPPEWTTVQQLRAIYAHLEQWLLISPRSCEAALAFLDDIEGLM